MTSHPIRVIDSHTGGEPTRVIVENGPDLGSGPLKQRVDYFREHFDRYRTAIVNEPRGSDVMVGALLCPPHDSRCVAGVIFFNNVGYLGMCGHGTIGLIATLRYLNAIERGSHWIDTPVGPVQAELHDDDSVSIQNVDSYRVAAAVTIDVPGIGKVTGDVAWGGNWFYLVKSPDFEIRLDRASELTEICWQIRLAINAAGFPEVDHVELFGDDANGRADSRNFVLCPGKAYDRSPCGTGTSAKLACLAADGLLDEGQAWKQASILGSLFEGQFTWSDREKKVISPRIKGRAHVNADLRLIIDPQDEYAWGIR
jgi:4-hydroxyproline epimerase